MPRLRGTSGASYVTLKMMPCCSRCGKRGDFAETGGGRSEDVRVIIVARRLWQNCLGTADAEACPVSRNTESVDGAVNS